MKQSLLLLLVICGLTACDDPCTGLSCESCDYPIELTFKTPDDAPLDARIVGASSECNEQGCVIGVDERRSGEYRLEISAKGYKSKSIVVAVKEDDSTECCACGYITQKEEIILEHVSDAEAQSATADDLTLCQQNCGLPEDPDDPFDSRCPKKYPFLTTDPLSQVQCSIEGARCYYCSGNVVTKSVACSAATGWWTSQLVCAVP